MGSVTQLWNPRGNRALHRYWVAFDDLMIIEGEDPEHAGVLSVRPDGPAGLRARLRVLGGEFESMVEHGCDITTWINGLALFIGVKAIEETRMLVVFGVPRDSTVAVRVALDAGSGLVGHATDFENTATLLCSYSSPRTDGPLQTVL